MKAHKLLFSTLIAASAMTATAYAEETPSSITWNIAAGHAYKWVGSVGDDSVETGGNWVTGTLSDGTIVWSETSAEGVPSRADNHGPLLYFDTSVVTTGSPGNTSDGGGVWVTNNSTATVSMGAWAGSIQVDAGSTANVSWSAQLKDGNIVANGIVNLTADSINLDTSTTRVWYTGENGEINSSAKSLTAWWESSGAIKALGSGCVNFNSLTSIKNGFSIEAAENSTIDFSGNTVSGGSIILSTGTIRNLTIGGGTTLVIDYETSLGSGTLSDVVVSEGAKLNITGVVSGQSYNLFSANNFSGVSNFSVDNITIDGKEIGGHGASASLSESGVFSYSEGVTYSDMLWTGGENTIWNRSAKNWSSATEGSGESIAFENGDSVKFAGAGSTVSLENGATLSVGDMTVESGSYSLSLAGGTSEISGKKLSVASGASLAVGTSNWYTVGLSFNEIEVFGTLEYNNGNTTWSSLIMKEGSSLFINDTASSGDGLRISQMVVDGTTTITSKWNKIFTVDKLSGSGEFSMTGAMYDGVFTMNLSDISDYSGEATFNSGNKGLTVNLTGDTSVNSAAKLVFNSGVIVNNTGTLTLDGEIALSGVINNTGTINISKGALNVTNGGNLTITGDGNSISEISGTVNILSGGTAKFVGHDLMGWGGDEQEASIVATLTGEDGKLATLYLNDADDSGAKTLTFARSVKMAGNAKISTEVEGGNFDTFGGLIVATGTNNTISDVEIRLRKTFTVEVSQNGDSLDILSNIVNTSNDGQRELNMIKTGAGILTLSGSNSYSGGTTVSAGTLIAASSSALGKGAVKVVSGAKLQADVAVTLSSDLTLVVSAADKEGAGLISGAGVTLADTAKLLVDIQNLTLPSSGDANNEVTLNIVAANALSVDQEQIQLGAWLGNVWTEYEGEWFVQDWNSTTGVLTLAIPEPSLFGLLAGLGVLALVGTRRRKKA